MGGASTSYGSPASQSPSSLGINPQTCWESIRRDRLLTNPSTFSEAASLFDPGVRGVLRIESTLCRLRFYLHLARNSRFPSRLNLLLSFSRFTVGIPPRGWFRKGWIKYSKLVPGAGGKAKYFRNVRTGVVVSKKYSFMQNHWDSSRFSQTSIFNERLTLSQRLYCMKCHFQKSLNWEKYSLDIIGTERSNANQGLGKSYVFPQGTCSRGNMATLVTQVYQTVKSPV